MDLVLLNSVQALHQQGLAQPWEFQGKSGFRLLPQTAPHVALLLHWTQQQKRQLALSEAEAGLLAEPLWLDLSLLKQVRQYSSDDFMIQVECGMTFRELLATIAPFKQAWPLSYPPNATIGEILASERPALETGLRGYPRDYVLKIEVATPDEQLTISGADVVKNVTGFDLAKLHIGGHHSFGVLTSVTLKLAALAETRRQWLYRFESLSAACLFNNQFLNSKLPLSVCELFQQAGQWCILIELAGDDAVLSECEQVLHQFIGPQPEILDTRSGQELLFALQNFPPQQTVLEIAFPLSRWQGFVSQISKQASLGEMRFQVRPAAGLVYISAPLFPSAALQYLKEQAQTHEGFVQLMHISKADAATVSDATTVFAEFNLPADPILRRLLSGLKKSYDPEHVLFTPRLPLACPEPQPV